MVWSSGVSEPYKQRAVLVIVQSKYLLTVPNVLFVLVSTKAC